MDDKRIIERIDSLLNEVDAARSASPYSDLSGGLPAHKLASLGLRLKVCIAGIVPNDTVYFEALKDVKGHEGNIVNGYAAILEAIRTDIEEGYFNQAASFDIFNTDLTDDDTPFSAQETELLNKRLTEVEEYLIKHAAQSEQQEKDIRSELAWLKSEIKKSDKKTWKRIFVGTIATKIMDWGLSPDHINTVFHQMLIHGSKLLE